MFSICNYVIYDFIMDFVNFKFNGFVNLKYLKITGEKPPSVLKDSIDRTV